MRPLEEPRVLHTAPISQPPPAKKPNLGNATPPVTTADLPTEQQHPVEAKEEPIDASEDGDVDTGFEEQNDVKPMINTRLQEASSSQLSANWLNDLKPDQCSPGK